jgi:hypothetical protein
LGISFLFAYPMLFLAGFCLALFLTFRFGARGGSPLLVVLMLLALLLFPALLRSSRELAGPAAV